MVSGAPAMAALVATFAIVAVQRVAELRVAKRHQAWALQHGGRLIEEPHYWMFFVLHTGWLFAWLAEAWVRGPALATLWPAYVGAFVLAGFVRYWAITSLGERWNTKIIVFDGLAPIRRGPYRFLNHPNYLVVAVELACVPLIFDAWITAAACSVLNAALLLGLRIPAEMKAMAEAQAAGERTP